MDDDEPPNARAPAAAGVLLTDEGCALAVDPGTGAGGSADSLIRASQLDALDFLASTLVHDLCGPLHNVQLKLSLLQASIAEAEELTGERGAAPPLPGARAGHAAGGRPAA
jgi:hypothetical protein